MEKVNKELSPEQKAAAVIVALGVDKASKVYKFLSAEEVEKLTLEVARLGHVEADTTESILDEFYKNCLTQKVVTEGGMEYAREVLEKAYDENTANELLQKMTKYLKNRSFDFIQKTDAKNLYSILQYERPQTIALVLSYADADLAASVVSELSVEKRLKVVEAIALMDRASPQAIKIVENQLRKKCDNILTTDYTTIGGIDYIADVINKMDRSDEKSIFDKMNTTNPRLAEDIRKKMFVFEDIILLDNRSVQRFIRECDMKDIVYALKNASKEITELFYANMSKRMAETIQADLEVTGNLRLKDVEEAQQRIVALIRHLDETGEIIISKGGKDDILV